MSAANTGVPAASHTFRYAYLPNSDLVSALSVDNSPFTISRGFEPQRDVLTSIAGQWSTATRTRYDYLTNALGQRTSVKQSGDAFLADYGDSTYQQFGYDGKGELSSATGYLGSDVTQTTQALPGRGFVYNYDTIGNRTSTSRTVGVAAEVYTANALNQIATKQNNTVQKAGTADSAATVQVAGRSAAPRQGRYWSDEVPVGNGSGPWRGPLLTYVGKNGAGPGGSDLLRVDSRMAQLPAANQSFSYDADGNLLSDGMWDYTWDAENRLTAMQTTAAAMYVLINQRLEFKYDYLGRRIEKLVRGGWNGSTFTTVTLQRRFVYDGWNLIAEYSYSGSTLTLVRNFVWGLDIATDLEKAGGVGALLQIADHASGKTYLPTYDGNGNVASLINADSGAFAAVYEYSPYGELLRSETNDPIAADQPFRFSTKYYDAEAGMYYYGHRYYSPNLGRFVGRDPSAERGGLHLYAFCLNNPTSRWDVLGNYPDFGTGSFVSGGNVYSTNANGQVYFNYGATVNGLQQFVDPTLSANPLNSFQLAGFGSCGSTVAWVNGGGTTDGVYVDSAVDAVSGVPYTSPFYTVTYTSSRVSLGSLSSSYGPGGGGGGWSPSITLPPWMSQNRGSSRNPQNTTMAGLRDDITMALQGIDSLTNGKSHLYSDAAIALLLGTAAQESGGLQYRVQKDGGPARGLFQMQKGTYDDLWNNYLSKKPEIADAIKQIFTPAGGSLSFDMIQGNDAYAAVMARLRYAAGNLNNPLPDPTDVTAMANYWNDWYNRGGAGNVNQFVDNYNRYVAPVLNPPPTGDGGGGDG